MYIHFQQGGFSVQIGSSNPIGRIPVDQAIEEPVNKDTQTPGGTKGFSLKHGAVTSYYLMSEYRSKFLRQLRCMVDLDDYQVNHPDLHLPRIRRDEANVSMVQLMETSWLNSFSRDQDEFVSLSTSTVAPPNVSNDLLEAHRIGEEAYQSFKQEHLEASSPKMQFHDKMTKKKLMTFSDIRKKSQNQQETKNTGLMADRKLFGHMVLVDQSRDLHMSDVLVHPLGPVPWAFANSDGSLCTTNKTALARVLEKMVFPAEVIPEPSSTIIDGMRLIQRMTSIDKTFSQLAGSALSSILQVVTKSQRIDVVFDVYRVKNTESGAVMGIQSRNIAPGPSLQRWRKLLCSSSNKASLIKFLVNTWKQPLQRKKLVSKSVSRSARTSGRIS